MINKVESKLSPYYLKCKRERVTKRRKERVSSRALILKLAHKPYLATMKTVRLTRVAGQAHSLLRSKVRIVVSS